jgi:hypothetical protein
MKIEKKDTDIKNVVKILSLEKLINPDRISRLTNLLEGTLNITVENFFKVRAMFSEISDYLIIIIMNMVKLIIIFYPTVHDALAELILRNFPLL